MLILSRIEEARHVVHRGETRRNVTKYLLENVEGRDHLENDIKWRIILKLILGSWLGQCELDCNLRMWYCN
jgi:hypothetical protein